ELDVAGFSASMAKAIVAHREKHGDFESVDELLQVPGMTVARLNLARRHLSAEDVEAFFNSRPLGAPEAGTGYGRESSSRTSALMNERGEVVRARPTVTAGVADLFHRAKPGQTVRVAMYGMSSTSGEFRAMVAAARRGVAVKVVLNDAYTASTVTALKALAQQGLPVEVRVQTAKTMHEKFGVIGDDVFFGSANFSESSSTKHSEDRFVVKNSLELSEAFAARFDELWGKSKVM
ncbi:MAG: phospholipase D-like domain-containing protein, partial [Myxococcales bacterium]